MKDAIKGARKSKLEYVKSKLNEHQRFLLDTIEKQDEIDSGELFRTYQESFRATGRKGVQESYGTLGADGINQRSG